MTDKEFGQLTENIRYIREGIEEIKNDLKENYINRTELLHVMAEKRLEEERNLTGFRKSIEERIQKTELEIESFKTRWKMLGWLFGLLLTGIELLRQFRLI